METVVNKEDFEEVPEGKSFAREMDSELSWWGLVVNQKFEEKSRGLFARLCQLKVIYETGLFDEDQDLLNEWKFFRGEFENDTGKGVGCSGELPERQVSGEVARRWVEVLKRDSEGYKNYVMKYVRAAAILRIDEYDKKEVRSTMNGLLGLLVTTGEVPELTDEGENVADWLIRKKREENHVLSDMRDVRATYLLEGSKELHAMMYKWRKLLDEGELSSSHPSEQGVDMPIKCEEEAIADFDTIGVRTLGGERVRVVFNMLLDDS